VTNSLLIFVIYFIINLISVIHVIFGFHLMLLVQYFPTSVSVCSLFRLGEFCVIKHTLLMHKDVGSISINSVSFDEILNTINNFCT
jgi:hypothetical protein